MKFEKEVYCSFCGYAIVDVVFHTLDKEENQGHKGAHLAKVEIVAVCDECERATTNIFNNRQDFTKPNFTHEIIDRTNDPIHDVIQNEANLCSNCGGSMHNGICAACRAVGV